jgi:hypothetical protein
MKGAVFSIWLARGQKPIAKREPVKQLSRVQVRVTSEDKVC